MDLLSISQTRYTTKAYDPTKKIPQQQFERLLEILRLSPSSINIQPWHFLIAQTDEAKRKIATSLIGRYAYNAPKVLDSSHTIVLCTYKDISAQHLENLLDQDERRGRFKDNIVKQGQRDSRLAYVDFYRKSEGGILHWAENQTFIALGQLLFAASAEKIDATAIGGFDQDILTDALHLSAAGLVPSVLVTLGYRSEQDFNAKLPKSRLEPELLFTVL